RLINLINSLLDIEKMEDGKLELQVSRTPVTSIIDQSLASVKALIESKTIDLQSSSCNEEVSADSGRLVQVLVNLLSNAIKFSPKGGTIRISAECENGWVEFKVQDHGRGVPTAYKEKIFDRFEQVDIADSQLRGGS